MCIEFLHIFRHVEHISPSADSTQSEKEAAIAAVAAATGRIFNEICWPLNWFYEMMIAGF